MLAGPTATWGKIEADWATHPGDHLRELIDLSGLSDAKWARKHGITPKTLCKLLAKKQRVTAETALKLEYSGCMKAEIWLNLQSNYDLHVARSITPPTP